MTSHAWAQLALWVLGGCALAMAGLAIGGWTEFRDERLRTAGRRATGRITAIRPGGFGAPNTYTPYPDRFDVEFQHDGAARSATIWLEHSTRGDYAVGDSVDLLVSKRGRQVRTLTEPNADGQWGPALGSILFLAGAVLVIAGIVRAVIMR